tara:strand:- start:290 stop:703 length:414 start_codon:yes stop_codon:yes gene_type:complete
LNLKSLFLLIAFFQITSCVSTNKKSHVYSELDIKVKTALEAKVDVDMKKKLFGSSSSTYIFGLIKIFGHNTEYADGYGGFGRIGRLKSAAAYKAIKKGKGDILVSPQYEVIKTNYLLIFSGYEVKVRGYDGKIISID